MPACVPPLSEDPFFFSPTMARNAAPDGSPSFERCCSFICSSCAVGLMRSCVVRLCPSRATASRRREGDGVQTEGVRRGVRRGAPGDGERQEGLARLQAGAVGSLPRRASRTRTTSPLPCTAAASCSARPCLISVTPLACSQTTSPSCLTQARRSLLLLVLCATRANG